MYCPDCQASLPDAARFCRECGRSVTAYAPPEGFEIDRSSLLFYRDDGAGADGMTKYITWFYPDTGEYEQVGYPGEAPAPAAINSFSEASPEIMPASVTAALPEPVPVSAMETDLEPVSAMETDSEPAAELMTETDQESAAELMTETNLEPVSAMETDLEPASASAMETDLEPAAELMTETDLEPVSASAAEMDLEPTPASVQASAANTQAKPPQAQAPEGFQYDRSSGLYYIVTPGNDLTTNAAGNWYTWFYPDSGEFKQVFYPF